MEETIAKTMRSLHYIPYGGSTIGHLTDRDLSTTASSDSHFVGRDVRIGRPRLLQLWLPDAVDDDDVTDVGCSDE